jgi:hypothetical protein
VHATDQDFQMLGKEHALLVPNHSYDVDWLMGAIFIQNLGTLGVSRVYADELNTIISILCDNPSTTTKIKFRIFIRPLGGNISQ